MEFLRRLAVLVGLVLLVSCGGSDTANNDLDSPGVGSALVQLPLEERRIAIVHSASTKTAFYDGFAYNQLFASVQHQAMMAGLPFDLLSETDLAQSLELAKYEAIVLPGFSHIGAELREAIKQNLLTAQQAGVGIVAAGEVLGFTPDGSSFADFGAVMAEVLGVLPQSYLSGVSASVRIADNSHPVSKTYETNEALVSYDQIWFGAFAPLDGEQSTVLTEIVSGGVPYPGAQVIERAGRVVHFANDQVMADNNQLWRILQWVVYGDVAPVSLQVSRADHVFLARNDMDQAMIAASLDETEIPLLDIIKDWKQDYNFVGSYYIDIGNNPANGEYTDWGVSGPLYQQYMALGNEIGTHSWTHPHHTALLNAEELEFEFKDSAAEIGERLGVPVSGAAVPGNPESLFVVDTLDPWFEYLSGRTGAIGSGYQSAFGFLEPDDRMMYFSLNMSPDFTLIDFLKRTPAQSEQIWRDELDGLLNHAQQPLIHWLWHDYGPTTQTAAGFYTKEMFSETLAYAASKGAEFATLKDIHDRMRVFADTRFLVGSDNTVKAVVDATGVGQFALKITEKSTIKSVSNWYAYDEDQIFLPDNGGEFTISLGAVADSVTRINKLPMRARLIELTGNGNQLNFSMHGEGDVSIVLSDAMINNASVSGADSFVENNGVLTLRFNTYGVHNVAITPVTPINQSPVADGGTVTTETAVLQPLLLTGSDAEGSALTFTIDSQPSQGVLTGTAPNLYYQSNAGFSGVDSFTYSVSDGAAQSEPVSFTIEVKPVAVQNAAPLAVSLVLESVINQSVAFELSGNDRENQPLSYTITAAPAHGSITGTSPALIYTPENDFTGSDVIEFIANDGGTDSEPATVVINVSAELGLSIGTVSNQTTGITLDGNLSDWSAFTSFGIDPQDVTGALNLIDWQEAWMSHDETHFYLAFQEHNNDGQLLWGNQVFFDTDSDRSTGFTGFSAEYSIGADYLLEGDALFRFEGDIQNTWSWTFLGSVESAGNGNAVELKIDRNLLGEPNNLLLFFNGNSEASLGDALDLFPDQATDANAVLRLRRFSYSVNENAQTENHAPIAFSQSIQLSKTASYPVTLNGFDLDGDPLEFVVDRTPLTCTLTGDAPNLVYMPDGSSQFEIIAFRVFDGSAYSDAKSIQLNLVDPLAVNNRPAASDLTLAVTADSPLVLTLEGNDIDGDDLTYTIVAAPLNGTLSGVAPDLTYTSDGVPGIDQFSYSVNDGETDSALATVTIEVTESLPPNAAPQAGSLSLSTNFDTAMGVELNGTDADNDTLSYSVVTQPVLGSLSGTAPLLTYIPFAGSVGTESFSYIVNDGQQSSTAATVIIEILPPAVVNQKPVANGQTLTTQSAVPLVLTLGGSDADNDVLSYQLLTQPTGGALTGTVPDLFYTAIDGFTGVDSFTFIVNDGQTDSAAATVTINVGSDAAIGPISNPISSLTVDGSLTDWNGLQALGSDPADVAGVVATNPLDWRKAWVAHSATDLYIAYQNHEAFTLSWGHGIFVDVDGDINTGFRGFSNEFPIGADILIETDDVQQYTGTGNDWAWLTSGAVTVTNSGNVAELSLALSDIGDPSVLKFYFKASNSAFGGNTVDHFPDAAIDLMAPASERYLEYHLTP